MSGSPRYPEPGPRVLILSLPKSGTHLLNSLFQVLPPFRYQPRLGLTRKLVWHPLNLLPGGSRPTCFAGISEPRKVKIRALRHSLARIRAWRYSAGHIPFQPAVLELIMSFGISPYIVIRDPRDVVVSSLHYVLASKRHFMHETIACLPSDRERLRAIIEGGRTRAGVPFTGIASQIDAILGWTRSPEVMTVRFEELIGERGGASRKRQIETILAVARHAGIALEFAEAQCIGQDMFGIGATFRRGRIGGWTEELSADLLHLVHREIGSRWAALGYDAGAEPASQSTETG